MSTIRPRSPPSATRWCAVGNLFQRESACHPRGQLAGVDERGELSQPRPVGVNPDVVHARAAQGDGPGAGRDGHEGALVPDGIQGGHAGESGVERTVHPAGHDRRTAPPRSWVRATNSSAPSSRTSSSSRGAATATVRSPRSVASSSANPPTAPAAPVTSSHWPGRSASRSSAWSAVRLLSGMVDASTGPTLRGAGATASVSRITCSACARPARSADRASRSRCRRP